jgi:plasmid stabilization system protein ParE
MMWQIIIKPSAQLDIDDAFIWYETALDNLGFEFLLSLDASIQSISRNPLVAGYAYLQVRSINLSRFPYSLYYITEADRVVVLAVLHHSRNPDKLRKRVQP